MAIYTVHEPPLRAADVTADPGRFAFVRDGFYVWAFLLTVPWMLRHRLWLVLLGYVVVLVGLAVAMIGAAPAAKLAVLFLVKFLIGLEGGTLRRFTLSRRGWKNGGVVSGGDVEDAEQRFFEAWTKKQALQPAVPPPAASPPGAPMPPPLPRAPQAPGVIGLFPEPGAQR
jgi:hypothetical protein